MSILMLCFNITFKRVLTTRVTDAVAGTNLYSRNITFQESFISPNQIRKRKRTASSKTGERKTGLNVQKKKEASGKEV